MRYPRMAAFAATLALTITVTASPLLRGGAAGAAPTKPAPSGVTFGSPSVVDPVHTYGEPDIHVAYDGTIYDSGPWGTGTQRSLWEQSTDGGHAFHAMHSSAISSPDQSDSVIGAPAGGGGDTEISIDRQNRVYYADLAALASLKVARWDRSTKSMNTGFFGDGTQNINGVDRQWFAM